MTKPSVQIYIGSSLLILSAINMRIEKQNIFILPLGFSLRYRSMAVEESNCLKIFGLVILTRLKPQRHVSSALWR